MFIQQLYGAKRRRIILIKINNEIQNKNKIFVGYKRKNKTRQLDLQLSTY